MTTTRNERAAIQLHNALTRASPRHTHVRLHRPGSQAFAGAPMRARRWVLLDALMGQPTVTGYRDGGRLHRDGVDRAKPHAPDTSDPGSMAIELTAAALRLSRPSSRSKALWRAEGPSALGATGADRRPGASPTVPYEPAASTSVHAAGSPFLMSPIVVATANQKSDNRSGGPAKLRGRTNPTSRTT